MAKIKEYFLKDFPHVLSGQEPQQLKSNDNQIELEIISKIHYDFDANAIFLSFYIPKNKSLIKICHSIIDNPEWGLKLKEKISLNSSFFGTYMGSSNSLIFTNRIYLYADHKFDSNEVDKLTEHSKKAGLYLVIRGTEFAEKRNQLERPLAFISHDSRDKEEIARPLAIQLTKLHCPVWFDDFSLTVGQSLRGSIEKGLKECKKCILIISQNFLKNEGWTKKEFDSIFTREMIETTNLILPVWHGVNEKDVFQYSPSLADKVALKWKSGEEEIARKLFKEIVR